MSTNIQEQIERRRDGSLFFQAQVVAVVQMDGSPGVSTAIAALDQRRTVERAQAGEQGQRQARPSPRPSAQPSWMGSKTGGGPWMMVILSYIGSGNHTIKKAAPMLPLVCRYAHRGA
ncbi:MAG: hypothetical protein Q7U34_00745 [Anaerolineales bacterium]|nr:hypothetical protein [Anaerolineales bacterium]